MQEPNSFIVELCGYTVEWDEGWMEHCKAIPGSSIAAVGDGVPPISVYYQGPDKAIYEKKDNGVWQDVRQLVCGAIALTAISAIFLKSAPFIILSLFLNSHDVHRYGRDTDLLSRQRSQDSRASFCNWFVDGWFQVSN
jgi:hypothetical protein